MEKMKDNKMKGAGSCGCEHENPKHKHQKEEKVIIIDPNLEKGKPRL